MKKLCTILLLWLAIGLVHAQQRSIKGTVVDEDGFGLPGASIQIKGTQTGTITDLDGVFMLKAKTGDVLAVSFIGYKTQEQTVESANEYRFVMGADALQLDQVVVVGYTKERKSDISGAITVVNTDALSEEASPNVLTAMQGRIPGLQINSGGTPGGSDSQIAIRGLTTVNSGSSPLWVIDGVQTTNPSAFNPDEIESIQVLKDGASTALYGTSAANGVIVVTTKKGKDGVSEFNVKAEMTVNMLRDNIDVLNAQQWADVYYQARANDGVQGNFNALQDNGNGFVIPEYLNAEQTLRASDTNWVDEIIDTSVSYTADASYRYGNKHFNLFTSLGYSKDNGIQKYTSYERVNARVNASYKFWNDRITIGENFMFSRFIEVKANEFESAIMQNPLLPVYAEDGTYMAPSIQDKPNVVANLWSNRKNKQRNNRFLGNIYTNVHILKGLDFSTKLNFDITKYKFDTRTEPFLQMGNYPSAFMNIDVDDINNDFSNTIWTSLLTYEYEWDKHRINAMAGVEFTRQDEDFETNRIRGVDITSYPAYTIREDAVYQTIKNEVEYRKQSQFGSLKYVYDSRYIVSGSLRRDGSSRFGPNNKYGIFPAASVAWNASNESFMEEVDWLSSLKLRASWGVNGNDQIGNYLYLGAYVNNTSGNVIEFADYDIDGDGVGAIDGLLQARQANPDIKWEETTQYNAGFDVAFWHSHITASFDVFDKRTKNLILQPIAQAVSGESVPPTINAGEVSNKGFEFVIGYDSFKVGDFRYGVDFNFASYVNEVESLDSDNNFLLNNSVSITTPGEAIASFYGLVADGIFRTPEEVAVHASQSGKDVGMIRYRDINNDGVIDNNDRTIIGNPHPDFTYGFNLKGSYKNWSLNLYFDGKQGNDIYNMQRYQGDYTYFSFNFGKNTLDAWSPDNANSNIPKLSTIDSNNQRQPSSYYVEDGSYFRLKTISLGYSVPESFTDKIGLNTLRLSLVGQNLWSVTSFSGFDYEVSGLSASGIGIAGYGVPHTKSITFGVTANF